MFDDIRKITAITCLTSSVLYANYLVYKTHGSVPFADATITGFAIGLVAPFTLPSYVCASVVSYLKKKDNDDEYQNVD